ncbi:MULTISPECIES: RidA family protein [unclassified Crossiella]|uniref:RidA family protein n=1 Tax=unclassified Crossiella TaxID=2620835 RepID=UPI001FFFA7A7|nr:MULTISPECIES: Rid family detoxifying hydrolase [unclassified Crossiella]MCK2243111.1 Rid family detoxifying hydrolase [Crossiella sp. S99.2]MCK2256988.1 Rid family detoxifying hydrolase [Crossiella sp. S99.1]
MRNAVNAPGAVAVGPYSHAVDADPFVHLSGQTPVGPDGKLVQGSVGDQTRQCFANLFAVLDAAGLTPDDVLKCTVFLTDMADFAAMNAVYAEQFAQPFPARTTIGVAGLPLGANVEIELIARRPGTS